MWNRRSKWVLSRFSHSVYLRIQFRLDNTLENQQNNLLNITKVFYPFCFLLSPLYQLLSFIVHHRLVVGFFSLVIFSFIFQSSWLAAVLFDFFFFRSIFLRAFFISFLQTLDFSILCDFFFHLCSMLPEQYNNRSCICFFTWILATAVVSTFFAWYYVNLSISYIDSGHWVSVSLDTKKRWRIKQNKKYSQPKSICETITA